MSTVNTQANPVTSNDLSQIKSTLEQLDSVDWNDPKSDLSGYRKLNLVACLGERVGPLVREIEMLRDNNKAMRMLLQKIMDSQQLHADDYEGKYYPEAGPTSLDHEIREMVRGFGGDVR